MSLPPINPTPSSISQDYVDSYYTLPSVMWEAVTSVVGYPDEGYYETCWIAGFWSTHIKVESIVLKAAWHWVLTTVL
jgi:hypothetical protein